MRNEEAIVQELVELEADSEVVDLELADCREFLGATHNIWRVRTVDGKEWWAIPVPIGTTYPAERWPDLDELFSYHIGSVFRYRDAQGRIHPVGPPLIGAYPPLRACGH